MLERAGGIDVGLLGWLVGGGCDDLSPQDVRKLTETKDKPLLVDVRTPNEHASRKIDGSKLIPLQDLGQRYKEIPMDKDVVIYCATGTRSVMACRFLKKMGYSRVKNMAGGISRW